MKGVNLIGTSGAHDLSIRPHSTTAGRMLNNSASSHGRLRLRLRSRQRGFVGGKSDRLNILLEGFGWLFYPITLLCGAEADLEDHPAAFFAVHYGS